MYWPLLNMYSENFGFGLGGFIINRTFKNRMKGLQGFQVALSGMIRVFIKRKLYWFLYRARSAVTMPMLRGSLLVC